MATTDPTVHRFSVDDVYRMADAGVLDEEHRVELIDGLLFDMSPPGPSHSTKVSRLTRHLVLTCPDHELRVQDMLLVEGGFVMPDLMLLHAQPPDRQPSTATLVVEVAVTTLRHDTRKARRYARADVDAYWLIDAEARSVLVHTEPGADGYRSQTRYGDGDTVPGPVAGAEIAVTELLGAPAPGAHG